MNRFSRTINTIGHCPVCGQLKGSSTKVLKRMTTCPFCLEPVICRTKAAVIAKRKRCEPTVYVQELIA